MKTFGMMAAVAAALTGARADYSTSGNVQYTSQESDPAAILGETPTGPYTWNHSGGAVNMYAGGLLNGLSDLATLAPARLELKDATVSIDGAFTVAAAGTVDGEEAGGSGELVLDRTTMSVSGVFSINNGAALGGGKVTRPHVGKLFLRNGSHLSVGSTFNLSANAATPTDGDSWVPQMTNELWLSSGSLLTLRTDIKRYDGPSGKIVFDGGEIELAPNVNGQGFFGAYGYGYDKSSLWVTNTPGHDVVLATSRTNLFFGAQTRGYFLVDGAIRKRGRGTLVLDGPSSNNGYVERFGFDGLKIESGTVFLYNTYTFRDPDLFPAGRRGRVEIAAGACLDINNNGSVLEALAGDGAVCGSSANGASLAVYPKDAPIDSRVKVGPGIAAFTKKGDRTAQLALLGTDCQETTVADGTLRLVDPSADVAAYTHYRFRVLKVNEESRADQIMELREIRLFEGTNDVTFASQYRYDAVTKGATGVFGNNELPQNAWDQNLKTKWCDLRHATQECWWVEFVYARPVQVSAYNWAKTDNMYRSPREWTLEGSSDGENWTVLDRQYQDTRSLPADQWVRAEPFPVTVPLQPRTERLGALTLADGATLDLSDLTADVEVTATDATKGTILLPRGGRLLLRCESDATLRAAVFAGSASTLVKTGTGKLSLVGRLPAGVRAEVREGELAFVPDRFSGKFFRFTVKGIRNVAGKDEGRVMNLGKLHLFDANGTVVNENLTWRGGNPTGNSWQNGEDGTPAADLTEGTFSQAGQYRYSIWNGSHEAPYWIFYPASDTHKWCTTEHVFDPDDPNTWYTLHFRIWDAAAPVVGYNLRSIGGSSADREVAAWSLEGSADGVSWILLDERSIGTAAPGAEHTWYNSGTPYDMDLREAKDDLPSVGSLAVDGASSETGTLTAFRPASDGMIAVVNVPSTALAGGRVELPLVVRDAVDGANATLKTWRVSVDGEELSGWRVMILDGRFVLLKIRPGFLFVVR